MLKKLTMLVMAIGALMVAPAMASANWTHSGEELESDAAIAFSGGAGFAVGEAAGAHAVLHAEGVLYAGSTTGTIQKVTLTNCTGTFGYTGLSCHATAKSLPWTFHATGNGIVITDIEIENVYTPAGLVENTILKGDVRATPNNSAAISSVNLSSIDVTANGNPASVSGTLGASPAGTYGY